MDKYYFDKYLENQFRIREISTTLVTVLVSGIIGVCLVHDKIPVFVLAGLVVAGLYFGSIFFKNMINSQKEIEKMLEILEQGELHGLH